MAISAVAAIAYIVLFSIDSNQENAKQRNLLFPDLFNVLDKVDKIEFLKSDNKLIVKKIKGEWVVESADDYPARVSTIKKFLLDLTEIKTIDIKTTDPSQYRNLAVNHIGEKGLNRLQITISIEQGKEIIKFIVKEKFHNDNRTFIKKVGQKEVFETQGALSLSADKIKWLSADIIDLSSNAIKRITVNHPDENFTLVRLDESSVQFKIKGLDKDSVEKSPTFTSAISAFLESLKFNDVKRKEIIKDSKKLGRFTFKTTDGEEIIVQDFETVLGVFTEFSIAKVPSSESNSDFTNPDLIQKFVFKLPRYKRRLLDRKLSDLTKRKSID